MPFPFAPVTFLPIINHTFYYTDGAVIYTDAVVYGTDVVVNGTVDAVTIHLAARKNKQASFIRTHLIYIY